MVGRHSISRNREHSKICAEKDKIVKIIETHF
jgi:hypothetical protein